MKVTETHPTLTEEAKRRFIEELTREMLRITENLQEQKKVDQK